MAGGSRALRPAAGGTPPPAGSSTPIRLPAALERQIRDHARATRPEECCGILAGRRRRGRIEVEAVEPTRNVGSGDRRRRYEIPPDRLLAAHRAARAAGREVVGYFHSHPDGGARPSAVDRDRAWPDTVYLIVGGGGGGAAPLRAWRLVEGEFVEEAIE